MVKTNPFPTALLAEFMQNALLVVVEIWWERGAFDPGIGFDHWAFYWTELHAVLFCAGGEDDAFEFFDGARDGKCL